MAHEHPDKTVHSGESLDVTRKKVLLRILSRREAERLGLIVSSEEVQAIIDEFRLLHGLITKEEMTQWLSSAGFSYEAFVRVMCDFATTSKIEQIYNREIEQGIHDQIRISVARPRVTNDTLSMDSSSPPAGWLQVNVALKRYNGDALPSARALFARLLPMLADWRRQQTLERFFFTRKQPDLRLRFLCHSGKADLHAELDRMLSRLQHDGFVKRFFPSIYEPEVFQFGGPAAMDLVHAYFQADSMAWIAVDCLEETGGRTIAPATLALAVMNDLFLRTLSCPFEVWDVWCNLVDVVPPAQETHPVVTEALLIDSLLPSVSKEEGCILRDYLSANQKLSAGLQQVWNAGKLQCGLRAILPFIAMFHFNRHGLNADRQAALASAMRQAWNPKQSLHGVEVNAPSSGSENNAGVA